MIEVNVNTKVEDVISSRPQIMRLAQAVFGRSAPNVLRAFGQFRANEDLASLIEAKRAGVFDYGLLIRDTEQGPVWPSEAQVLSCLMKAKGQGLTVDDISELVNDPALGSNIFEKMYGNKPATSEKKLRPVVVKSEQEPPAPEISRVVVTKEPEPMSTPVPVTMSAPEILHHLANLGAGQGHNVAALEQVLQHLAELNANLIALDNNLALVGSYLDPEIRKAGWIHVLELSVPKLEPAVVGPVKVSNAQEPLPPEPDEVTSAPVQAEPAAASGEDVVEVTEEAISTMGLDDLRLLATKLGIKDGHKIGYEGVARKKIRAALKLPNPS